MMTNSFSKNKTIHLKAILPFLIIFHHLSHNDIPFLWPFEAIDQYVLSIFFAMSGFGLVVSYANKPGYLDHFLKNSLLKLYIPYFICFVVFEVYRLCNDISFSDVINEKGICGLVPASWYIFVLSLFYVFFYLIFSKVHGHIIYKVIGVSAMIFAYYVIAKYTGVSYWRYLRTPAFCVGMFFGCFDETIRKYLKYTVAIILCGIMFYLSLHTYTLLPIFFGMCFMLMMYILPDIKTIQPMSFFSDISLEMYIIQYLPIYSLSIYRDNLNDYTLVLLVVVLDIALACGLKYLTKMIIQILNKM